MCSKKVTQCLKVFYLGNPQQLHKAVAGLFAVSLGNLPGFKNLAGLNQEDAASIPIAKPRQIKIPLLNAGSLVILQLLML